MNLTPRQAKLIERLAYVRDSLAQDEALRDIATMVDWILQDVREEFVQARVWTEMRVTTPEPSKWVRREVEIECQIEPEAGPDEAAVPESPADPAIETVDEQPDPGTAEQADPIAWIRNMAERGFELGPFVIMKLAPRSFEALRVQVAPSVDAAVDRLYVPELDLTAVKDPLGVEIDGWEEIKPESAEEPAPEPVEGEEAAPASEEAPAAVETPAETSGGDVELVDYIEDPSIEWTTSFVEELDGIQVSVQVKLDHLEEGKRSLFVLSGLSDDVHGRTQAAFSVDSYSFSASRKSMVEKAIELAGSLKVS